MYFSNHSPHAPLPCSVFYLHICLGTTCLPAFLSGQKQVSDILELELQVVVGHHLGAGNRALVLWKNSQLLLTLSHLSNSLNSLYCPNNIQDCLTDSITVTLDCIIIYKVLHWRQVEHGLLVLCLK